MKSEAAKKICDDDSKLDVKITIRNLKKEAMDDNESSGVPDGSDQNRFLMISIAKGTLFLKFLVNKNTYNDKN